MPLTLNRIAVYPRGGVFRRVFKAAADAAYQTGGYPLRPSTLGIPADSDPALEVFCDNTNGYLAHYDYTNLKLKFYSAAGTEVANNTNLSALNDIRLKIQSPA